KKMREWMASELRKPENGTRKELESRLIELVAAGLMSEKDAEKGRDPNSKNSNATVAPNKWMYWNVHLDGLERTHDINVEREGVFKECILAIKMAKVLGYQVATNTTVYKETDMDETQHKHVYI